MGVISSGSDKDSYGALTLTQPVFCPFEEPEERRRGGGPRPKTAAEKVAHFWARVKIGAPNACWPWTGSLMRSGYGQVAVRTRRPDGAHRVAYMLAKGPIPPGLEILHSCDTPVCCNPAHLSVGTHAENLQDARNKGRLVEARERPGAWVIEPELRRRLIAECLRHPPRSGIVARLAREHGLKFRSFVIAVHRARQKQQQQREVAAA